MTGRLFPIAPGHPDVSHEAYPPAVADRWETVLDYVRATAAEYRDDGWEVTEVHTGDVTRLTDDPFGFDVLAPDNEFDELEAIVDAVTSTEPASIRPTTGASGFS